MVRRLAVLMLLSLAVSLLLTGGASACGWGGWGCGWGGGWGGGWCGPAYYGGCYTPCYAPCYYPVYTCYTPCYPVYPSYGGCYPPAGNGYRRDMGDRDRDMRDRDRDMRDRDRDMRDRDRDMRDRDRGKDKGLPPDEDDLKDLRKDKAKDKGKKGPDSDLEETGRAPATLVVTLPADAELIVEGEPTDGTSAKRVFLSPPLRRGQEYVYTLRAVIRRNGTPLQVTRDVRVRAGKTTRVQLDFDRATVVRR